jgi:hypothetical protein
MTIRNRIAGLFRPAEIDRQEQIAANYERMRGEGRGELEMEEVPRPARPEPAAGYEPPWGFDSVSQRLAQDRYLRGELPRTEAERGYFKALNIERDLAERRLKPPSAATRHPFEPEGEWADGHPEDLTGPGYTEPPTGPSIFARREAEPRSPALYSLDGVTGTVKEMGDLIAAMPFDDRLGALGRIKSVGPPSAGPERAAEQETVDWEAVEAKVARDLEGYDEEAERREAAVEWYEDGFQPRNDYERGVFAEVREAERESDARREAARSEQPVSIYEAEAEQDGSSETQPVRDGGAISDDMHAATAAFDAGDISREQYEARCAGYHAELDELFAQNRAEHQVQRLEPEPTAEQRHLKADGWEHMPEEQCLEYLGDRAAEIAKGETAAHFAVKRMEADGVPASEMREAVRTGTFWKDSEYTAEAGAAEAERDAVERGESPGLDGHGFMSAPVPAEADHDLVPLEIGAGHADRPKPGREAPPMANWDREAEL